MAVVFFKKDPEAVLEYGFDWSDWLDTGDTISASTWTVPDGITEDSDRKTTTVTAVTLSGGTAGESYDITNHITTANGFEEDRTLRVTLEER